MMISTRGRYALRAVIDLAENQSTGPVPLKDIANRQNISLKYLERIFPVLTKQHLIEGTHGKGGGYKLTISPENCRVGDILRLTEGDLAPVSCLECNSEKCERMDTCRTITMWNNLNKIINDYLDNVTVADLMKREDNH